MKSLTRTDLALEREGGATRREYEIDGCRVCRVSERSEHGRLEYTTVHFAPLTKIEPAQSERARGVIGSELKKTAKRLVASPRCVLVACLGNPRLTPDSLGACTARALEVTRHVQLLDATAFSRFGKGALCMVMPGVLGDTGVESAELVRAVAREIKAELVVAVDALAAGGYAHLGAAVQICDHGLRPGSGIGNRRTAIDSQSIGCPVISLGIPTVIDGATMVCDALSQAGICGVGGALSAHLSRAKRYFVAPCDIDVLVERGGALLAGVIGDCFGV